MPAQKGGSRAEKAVVCRFVAGELATSKSPSWWRSFRAFPEVVGAVQAVSATVDDMARRMRDEVRSLEERLRQPLAAPPAFVSVVCFGTSTDGPRVLGVSGKLAKPGERLQLDIGQPFVDLTDVSIVVLCDLERVFIPHIFCGMDRASDVAFAAFPRWQLGCVAGILCELRR
jgi:hypothetical protein